MRQKFFTDTVENKFIHSLLHNFNFPICNTVTKYDWITRGLVYIYESKLVYCTETGYLGKPLSALNYDPTYYYSEGDFCYYNDVLYRCKKTEQLIYGQIGDIIQTELGEVKLGNVTAISSHGEINQDDVNKLQNYLLGTEILSELQLLASDVNQDGKVTTDDLLLLKNYLLQIEGPPVVLLYKPFNSNNWEEYKQAKFNFISNYLFGDEHNQYTYRYNPKYNYYDSESHKMLGNYLRCFRDIKGIDLMPFYNCYSFDTNQVLQIEGDTGTEVVVGTNSAFKVLQIPIKFNKTYTIAIDSLSNIKLNCTMCTKNGLMIIPVSGSSLNLTGMLQELYEPYMVKSSTSFKQPFTYRIENKNNHLLTDYNPDIFYDSNVTFKDITECTICEFLQRYEDYLYLLIQIPASNNSSVVVLEGDYTKTGIKNVVNVPFLQYLQDERLDEIFLSNLSLLQLNDKQSYPVADRLLEYLLQNVIGPDEQITNNINYVQSKLSVEGYNGIVKDIWNTYLRYLLYNKYMNNDFTTKLDFNGLADKDVKYYLDNYVWR